MNYFTGKMDLHFQNKTAVTLGKFDGLHRGHQKLFHEVLSKKAYGCDGVVFTFSTPPTQLLTGTPQSVINTNLERRNFLEELGMDYLIEYPFTNEICKMSPEIFIKEILIGRLNAAYVIVGEDFHFGYQRSGNGQLLKELSHKYGYQLAVMAKEKYGTRDISSSFVREELKHGNLEKANELLGYPFTIFGQVQKGRQIGRTLGMPTINLIPGPDKLLPPNGVYVSETRIHGKTYKGITNIGYKPTINEVEPKGVETYLFDWNGDLYDQYVEVMLLHFKREEKKFKSLEDLKIQIKKDVEYGRKYHDRDCVEAAQL